MARKQDVFGVTIDGDISGLKTAMYQAEKLFKETERSLKNVQKQAELEPTNADVLTKQMELYQKTIEEGRKAIRKLQADLRLLNKEATALNLLDDVKYKEKYTQLETEIKQLKAHNEDLKKQYKELGTVAGQVFQAKLKEFYHSLDLNFEAYERIKRSISNIDDQINLDPNNLDLYRQKQVLLDEQYRVGAHLVKQYGENLDKIRNTPGYIAQVVETTEEFTKQAKSVKAANEEIEKNRKINSSAEVMRFNNQLGRVSDSLIAIGQSTYWLSKTFRGFLTTSFEASKSYESNIANIKRVVSDMSESTIADLKALAIETGTAFDQIADYATISGSLGLAGDEVTEFTKAMIDLNTATGGVFNGEEGAKGIAVFLKQMGLGTEEAENFGSAVVEIGRRYADIGDETVNIATRMTALSAVIDTNQYELLGLAGVMADIGLSADTNANAINRSFLQIDKILSGGVKDADSKLQLLAKTAGMTSEQFRDAWGKNAMNAFITFVDGLRSSVFTDINSSIEKADGSINQYAETLGWTADQFQRAWGEDSKKVLDMYIDALDELGEEGEASSSVLSGIGLSSVFTAQTLLRLAGSGNEVRDAIKLVNDAWSQNTALQETAQGVYDTTERKLQGLFESLKQLGGSLVDNFTPVIKDMVDNFTILAQNVGQMSPAMQKLVTYFVAFGAGLSPVATNLGKLGKAFYIKDGVSEFGKALSGLKTLITGPAGVIGAIELAVTALAWADGVVKDNDALGNLKDRVGDLKDNLLETSRVADENFRQSMSGLFDGADEYIAKIQELIEINNDKSLPWSERNDARKQIEEYVSALNSIVGDEIYVFDSATGELRTQEDIIDDLKKSFSEYKFEIEKQNWLDAHKEELQQAQEALAQTNEEMLKATEDYVSHTQSVPQWVLDLLAENKGDVSALAEELKNQGFTGTDATAWIDTLSRFFPSYQEAMQKANAVQQDAQRYIDKYNEVETSSLENFNAIIGEIEKIPETVQPNFENTLATTEELTKQRQALSTALGNDMATTNLLIEAYDRELEKAPILSEWLQSQEDKWIETHQEANNMMTELDAWANEPLEKEVRFAVDWGQLSAPTWMWGQTPYASSGSRSGGYGDFRENIVQSALNPGMYRSGGVTVNASFNITNGNNIDRYTVREWGETLGEAINEYLGTQM